MSQKSLVFIHSPDKLFVPCTKLSVIKFNHQTIPPLIFRTVALNLIGPLSHVTSCLWLVHCKLVTWSQGYLYILFLPAQKLLVRCMWTIAVNYTHGLLCMLIRIILYATLLDLCLSVADPGFSPGGVPTPKIAIIFHIFAENCMKMKEFGPPGGARVPGAPLGSANVYSTVYICEMHCWNISANIEHTLDFALYIQYDKRNLELMEPVS